MHEAEYHDHMVKMLELIWGEGYMAPGGSGNVAKLLEGTEPQDKRILDIGCGIGGPARDMVRRHGARVVGIDLEPQLVDRATADARNDGLADRCEFRCVEPGPLPFADTSFDIVVSSGAITQTDDKSSLFDECFRVLRPGGWLSCYEWMKSARGSDSGDMSYWIELEGLTYVLENLEDYAQRLTTAGFEQVETSDVSAWYRAEARREYELIRGDLYATLVQHLGQSDADHFVENWRMLAVVCDSGELRQAYCRGRRRNQRLTSKGKAEACNEY